MIIRVATALLLALVVFACCEEPPPAEPEIDLAAETQVIRDLSAKWLEAARTRDGATIDSLFTQVATTIFDGKVHQGLEAIRAARELEWADEPQGEIDWKTTGVVVAAAGDLAVERGSWTERESDGDVELGEYLTVWIKVEGEWKVLFDAGTELDDDEEDEAGDDD